MIQIYKPFIQVNEKKYVNDCWTPHGFHLKASIFLFLKIIGSSKHIKEFKKIVHVIELKNMNIEQINNEVKLLFKKHD